MAGLDSIMKAVRFLPASVAVKALQKFNPKFKNYFADAAAYGFDINNALDYLNQRFSSEHGAPFEQKLEQRAMSGQARPDEMIARKEIQQGKIPGKIARSAASFIGGALLGSSPEDKATPELQQQNAPKKPTTEAGPREKSIRHHAEMTKKKKLIDQLQQEFENEYGQGNVLPSGLSASPEGFNANERIQQGTPGGGKSELIQALMEVKKILQ